MTLSDEEIARLRRITRFCLPIDTYPETGEPFGEVRGGKDPETGVHHWPHAVYPDVFHAFREQLVADGWFDGSYSQEEGFRYMEDWSLLERADLPTLQRLLLFCDRGEYWGAGFWKEAVESGFVPRALYRIWEIQQEAARAGDSNS